MFGAEPLGGLAEDRGPAGVDEAIGDEAEQRIGDEARAGRSAHTQPSERAAALASPGRSRGKARLGAEPGVAGERVCRSSRISTAQDGAPVSVSPMASPGDGRRRARARRRRSRWWRPGARAPGRAGPRRDGPSRRACRRRPSRRGTRRPACAGPVSPVAGRTRRWLRTPTEPAARGKPEKRPGPLTARRASRRASFESARWCAARGTAAGRIEQAARDERGPVDRDRGSAPIRPPPRSGRGDRRRQRGAAAAQGPRAWPSSSAPGRTAFTRIPPRLTSFAKPQVKASTAAFDAA